MNSGVAQNVAIAGGVFCCGCSLVNLLCLVCAGKKRRRTGRRFSAFCVLLSVAVVLYTLLVFLRKDLAWISVLTIDRRHVAFFLTWMGAGMLVAVSWKLFAPLLAVLYALASVGSVFLLQAAYGRQYQEYAVSLEVEGLAIDDVRFPRDARKYQTIVFSVERVSDLVLLPIPREWYRLRQVNEDDADFFYDGYYAGDVFLEDDAAALVAEQHSWQQTALRFLMAPCGTLSLYVPVPKDVLLPALFRLRLARHGDDSGYQLIRDL